MTPIEIIVIIFCVTVVVLVFGSWLYKKIKHLPTGDCAECHKQMKNAVKRMKKANKKKKRQELKKQNKE